MLQKDCVPSGKYWRQDSPVGQCCELKANDIWWLVCRQTSSWLSMKSTAQTMIRKLPGTPCLLKIQIRCALPPPPFPAPLGSSKLHWPPSPKFWTSSLVAYPHAVLVSRLVPCVVCCAVLCCASSHKLQFSLQVSALNWRHCGWRSLVLTPHQ